MGQFLGRKARAARSQTTSEMNIVWSPEAIEDLVSLRAYTAEDNPAAARRTVRHVIESIEQIIPDNPRSSRAGRVPGTRELVIPRSPYIVPYRLQRTTIQILRVYHGVRRWPDSLLSSRLPWSKKTKNSGRTGTSDNGMMDPSRGRSSSRFPKSHPHAAGEPR